MDLENQRFSIGQIKAGTVAGFGMQVAAGSRNGGVTEVDCTR
jgi:hypothetical protein